MSAAARLVSGSVASWAKIGVTLVAQVALVPLYLSHWSVVTYSIWISIQALVSVMSTLDFGHQEFMTYEFLRIGKENRSLLSASLWSSVGAGLFISLIQIVIVIILLKSDALPFLLGKSNLLSSGMIYTAGLVLLLQIITWFLCVSLSGLFFRALSPFGYYPRMAWWNLINSIVSSISPVIAVSFGAGLLTTGIVMTCTSVLLSIFIYIDLFRLLRKEKVPFCYPSLIIGRKNFVRSLAISGKLLLETARQQGVRLVLGPLAGASSLVAFSTMRTGANVALQGVNTITHPLMPELMRFLHQRDQDRVDASFGIVWIVVVAVMSPALVLLQAFIEPLYSLWTRGQVPFDPLLFAMLSLTVLVYAVAQPAMAVVVGNNLLKPQLLLSLIAAAIVIIGISFLVPQSGILGAGVALLCAEITATYGYRVVARRWLQRNELTWPKQSSSIAVTSVWIAAASMGGMIYISHVKWLIVMCSMLLFCWNFYRYWQALPLLVTKRAKKILVDLLGMKELYPI